MATVAQVLGMAAQFQVLGALDDAERLCRKVLDSHPQQPDAKLMLAILEQQRGENGAAVLNYRDALASRPRHAGAWNSFGAALHDTGDRRSAVTAYRKSLALEPAQPSALTNLGSALREMREFDAAVGAGRRAMALAPNDPGIVANLCNSLRDAQSKPGALLVARAAFALAPFQIESLVGLAGSLAMAERSDELDAAERVGKLLLYLMPQNSRAWFTLGGVMQTKLKRMGVLRAYQNATALAPDSIVNYFSVGMALNELSRHHQAAQAYRRVIAMAPMLPQAHNNLGNILLHKKQHGDAITTFIRAIALAPDHADAIVGLARVAQAEEQYAAAVKLCLQGLALAPQNEAIHNHLGGTLRAMERPDLAERSFIRALALDPVSITAFGNLARNYHDTWRHADAERIYRLAERLGPSNAYLLNNYANFLHEQERLSESGPRYLMAMAVDPAADDVRFNATFTFWKKGDFAAAYQFYEAGVPAGRRHHRYDYEIPRWEGEDLEGKHIVIEGEQGIGDEIRFASCFPDLIAISGRVTLVCEPRLVTVFQRSFPEAHVEAKASTARIITSDEADYWQMAGSLPRFFRPTLESFPKRPGFITPEPNLLRIWQERLAALPPGLRVGLAWRSKAMKISSFVDITTLEMWAPLFSVPGLQIINMQYDRAAAEIANVTERYDVEIHDWPEVDLMNDMENAFALAAAVDVGVTTCTSVNDIVGAVGTECLLYWRGRTSFFGTPDQPFFPKHRLMSRRFDDPAMVSIQKTAEYLQRLTSAVD